VGSYAKIRIFLEEFSSISTLIGGDKYATLSIMLLTYNMVLDKIERTKQLEQQNSKCTRKFADGYQVAYDKMVYQNKLDMLLGINIGFKIQSRNF